MAADWALRLTRLGTRIVHQLDRSMEAYLADVEANTTTSACQRCGNQHAPVAAAQVQYAIVLPDSCC